MSRTIWSVSLCVCAVSAAWGQSPAGAPAFEVASVKVSSSSGIGEGRNKSTVNTTPGSLNLRNFSLRSCVQWAYNLKDYQVTGPGWIDAERYDVAAKAADPVKDDELRKMLQTLLADRLKLEVHRETRELPVYALTVGKDGPKMKQSEGEAASNLKPGRGSKLTLVADHTSMAQFADLLGQPLQRPVVDMTGLKGGFYFTLDLSRYFDMEQMQKQAGEGQRGPDMATIESAVMMALREQLGLKLESKKSPIEMIVVDKAERLPTEN